MTEIEARESILEIQCNAAMAGHDLGPFEPLNPPRTAAIRQDVADAIKLPGLGILG